MEPTDPKTRLRAARVWFWSCAALALFADLLTKRLAHGSLVPARGESMNVIGGLLCFTNHLNEGGVFGMLPGKTVLLLGVTAFLVPVIVHLAYSCQEKGAPLWALGLLLGGALGNLHDRAVFGGVRDFLDLRNPSTGENLWPVFNVADAAIVAGAAAYLLWHVFFLRPGEQSSQTAENHRTREAKETEQP